MFCKHCHNLLIPTLVGEFTLNCSICQTVFIPSPDDMIIHSFEQNENFVVTKSGNDIFYFPANPKEYVDCPKCKYEITAWEKDFNGNKLRGCGQCNTSWY